MNIGNPGEFTMLELAEKVYRADRGAARSWCSSPCRQMIRSSAALTSSWRRKGIGWEPKVALGDGLKETIAY